MRVGITGASGRLGTILVSGLGEEDRFGIVPFEYDESTKQGLDLGNTEPSELSKHFAGLDAIIHLAANPDPKSAWKDLRTSNIDAAYNVFEAARLAGVPRILYSSSCHTQHGVTIDDFSKPESLREDPPFQSTKDRIVPSSLYGVTKALAEALGTYMAARYGTVFVAIRIGCIVEEDAPTQEERDYALKELIGTHAERFMRAILLTRADCIQLFSKALLADLSHLSPPSIVVYGHSNNPDPLFDLTDTKALLGYHPTESSDTRFQAAAALSPKNSL